MKKLETGLLALAFLLVIFSVSSFAAKEPAGVDSRRSYEMVTGSPADTFIIDVRTMAEYEFVGHPDLPNGVPNIPYKFYPSWEVNTDFVRKVKERYGSEDTIITLLERL